MDPTEILAAPSKVLQPRALIVTTYGLYARDGSGWLSIAALISLLADLGVDEPAVRSSISRLKRRGLLTATRLEGSAGYALSSRAREILADGDRRIFDRAPAPLADGWLLAVFSVPESERARRHTLRSRLTWLGFGSIAAGVWVAPAALYPETRETLRRLGLAGYVDLFRADYLAYADLPALVGGWWDLADLQARYDDFVAAYAGALTRWRRRRQVNGRAAFADYVPAVTAWRRLCYLDPGLPTELLPASWSGGVAAELFGGLRQRLAGPAEDYVAGVATSSWASSGGSTAVPTSSTRACGSNRPRTSKKAIAG